MTFRLPGRIDGSGRRIRKTVNVSGVKYEYDGDLLAAETDANNNLLAAYTYDDKGAPVSVTKNGQTYYFHYNAHGDVVALTDAHGNIAATYEYDEWGDVISRSGDIDTPFDYAGQYGYVYDKETGLYFLKSRYYDPATGRFTTRDRFKGFENRPLSQNPYTYCENDPVNKVDPEGLFPWRLVMDWVSLIIAAVAFCTNSPYWVIVCFFLSLGLLTYDFYVGIKRGYRGWRLVNYIWADILALLPGNIGRVLTWSIIKVNIVRNIIAYVVGRLGYIDFAANF